jgi:hypothetical protein
MGSRAASEAVERRVRDVAAVVAIDVRQPVRAGSSRRGRFDPPQRQQPRQRACAQWIGSLGVPLAMADQISVRRLLSAPSAVRRIFAPSPEIRDSRAVTVDRLRKVPTPDEIRSKWLGYFYILYMNDSRAVISYGPYTFRDSDEREIQWLIERGWLDNPPNSLRLSAAGREEFERRQIEGP